MGRILLLGAMIALSCSTCFAMFWPKSYPDGIQTEGLLESPPYMLEVFVWSWSLTWWLAEDAAKVLCRWIVHKYNIFDINNTGEMELTDSAKKLEVETKGKLKWRFEPPRRVLVSFVPSSAGWIGRASGASRRGLSCSGGRATRAKH